MYADLHLHSTFSDGTDTPLELFEIAGKNDIKVIAISDHDSVEGIKSVCNSGFPADIRLIPAIEVSTICNRRFMHLLGYYIDVNSSDLNSFITELSHAGYDILTALTKLFSCICCSDLPGKVRSSV